MKFDVFLSHNGKDKPAVEQLAHKLEKKGLKVWLDKWNLIPGEPWQEGLEEALDECQTYAVFVGPSGIGPWENEEMRVAIEERVKDKKRRVIPVLLPGAPDSTNLKLPRFLSRLTWVDFRGGLNDEDAFYRLECGIKGIAPKPLQKTGPSVSPAEDAIPLPADLPLGSYIPFPPNPLFQGRVPQLHALAESLLDLTPASFHPRRGLLKGVGGTWSSTRPSRVWAESAKPNWRWSSPTATGATSAACIG